MSTIETRMIDGLNESLADLEVGPLSDAGFSAMFGAGLDDHLELAHNGDRYEGSIDTPQLARVALALVLSELSEEGSANLERDIVQALAAEHATGNSECARVAIAAVRAALGGAR